MQAVSAQFKTTADSSYRQVSSGVLVAWEKQEDPAVDFFTIGESVIGGSDIIRGAGDDVTFFDKFLYDNETQYLTEVSTERSIGLYPWGTYRGMAEVVLDNTNKRFLPGFDPVIGEFIKPKRPIKIALGLDGESISHFVGFTDIPDNSLVNRETRLRAFDVFDFIDDFESDLDPFVDTLVNDIIEAMLIEMGFSVDQFEIEMSLQRPIGFLDPKVAKAGIIFSWLCEAEQALMFADEHGIIRFWNRQHLANVTDPVYTFTYSNVEDIQFSTTPIINDVIVIAKPRAVEANQKVWELSAPEKISGGQTLDIFVAFSDDDGELPVVEADTPVHALDEVLPTSRFTTNEREDGTGAVRKADINVVSDQLFGTTYRVTFQNTSTSPVFITTLEVFGKPAKVTTSIRERVTDDASIDAYGRNPDNNGEPVTIDNDFIQDRSTAHSAGHILINDYAEPGSRFTAPTFGAPHLQIGDLVEVNVLDLAEIKLMFIVAINTFVSRGGLRQEMVFEERALVEYFTIGESLIGGSDQIAP